MASFLLTRMRAMYYAIMSTLSFHVLATLTLLGTAAVQSMQQRGSKSADAAA
jgi:hypothetical protein